MSNKSVFDFVARKAKILCLTRVKVQISFISSLGLFIICIRLSLFRVQSDFGQGRTVSAISSKSSLSFWNCVWLIQTESLLWKILRKLLNEAEKAGSSRLRNSLDSRQWPNIWFIMTHSRGTILPDINQYCHQKLNLPETNNE